MEWYMRHTNVDVGTLLNGDHGSIGLVCNTTMNLLEVVRVRDDLIAGNDILSAAEVK